MDVLFSSTRSRAQPAVLEVGVPILRLMATCNRSRRILLQLKAEFAGRVDAIAFAPDYRPCGRKHYSRPALVQRARPPRAVRRIPKVRFAAAVCQCSVVLGDCPAPDVSNMRSIFLSGRSYLAGSPAFLARRDRLPLGDIRSALELASNPSTSNSAKAASTGSADTRFARTSSSAHLPQHSHRLRETPWHNAFDSGDRSPIAR